MTSRSAWTRQQLLVAFALYCRLPFGRLHSRNPEIIKFANAIGRTPSALAMKLVNIASLDPAITATGRKGLRSASNNDRDMWEEMQGDWDRFALESDAAMSVFEDSTSMEDDVGAIEDQLPIGKYRVVSAKARVGQSFFRAAVLSAYRGRCCITGLSIPSLLVASHIVPWRSDARNRVNPRNGLLLSALHDRAFDAGMLTVGDDMTVRVACSPALRSDKYFSDAIGRHHGQQIDLPEKFSPDPDFLAYHRKHIFKD